MTIQRETRHTIRGEDYALALQVEGDEARIWLKTAVPEEQDGEPGYRITHTAITVPTAELAGLVRAEGVPVDEDAFDRGYRMAIGMVRESYGDRRDDQRIGVGALRTLLGELEDAIGE